MINIFLILNIDMDFNYDVANMPGTYYTLLLKIFNNKLLNLLLGMCESESSIIIDGLQILSAVLCSIIRLSELRWSLETTVIILLLLDCWYDLSMSFRNNISRCKLKNYAKRLVCIQNRLLFTWPVTSGVCHQFCEHRIPRNYVTNDLAFKNMKASGVENNSRNAGKIKKKNLNILELLRKCIDHLVITQTW